jgi:hypothetical protein
VLSALAVAAVAQEAEAERVVGVAVVAGVAEEERSFLFKIASLWSYITCPLSNVRPLLSRSRSRLSFLLGERCDSKRAGALARVGSLGGDAGGEMCVCGGVGGGCASLGGIVLGSILPLLCVCVCVCVCDREREREGEREAVRIDT